MARECGFCPNTKNLTREHLWSEWMDELFPGEKRFRNKGDQGQILNEWRATELDFKARVVCKTCNNGWMSNIEAQHAKPALSDLIAGKTNVAIDQSRARSIALFCFKTAAVLDLISRNHRPFFTKAERYAFRESLVIPSCVNMWMLGFAPVGKGHAHTGYFSASPSPASHLHMYVCTYAVGHFVFQLVAARTSRRLEPRSGLKHSATPFWPMFASCVWPVPYVLLTVEDFDSFSMRWREVFISG